MKRHGFCALLALSLILALPGIAQDRPMTGTPQGAALDGYGYARFATLTSPVVLSDTPTVGFAVHPQARSALVCAETAAIYWRDDGTDPEGAEGIPIAAGDCTWLRTRDMIDAFRMISADNLAAELVTQTCVGWGLGTPVGAWSCATDTTITRTASGSDLTITADAPTAGVTYKVTWTIATLTAGSFGIAIGGTAGTTQTVAGTYTEYITAGDTTALTITASADAAGTIGVAVSVKANTGAAVARVRYGW